VFKQFTHSEALALKEFLLGIQAIDDSAQVRDMLVDLERYLALEPGSIHDHPSHPVDPAKVWDQIFDLGEALAKLSPAAIPH